MYGTDFRTKMNEIWNSVFQRQLGNMTNQEASVINSRYNNEAMNLVNQLSAIQQQRNGSLSYQDVDQFLSSYLMQILAQMRQANGGYYGSTGMIPNPMMSMNPMGGFGMQPQGYGYGFGMNRPMGGFNPNPGFGFGQPQAFRPVTPNTGMMPSPQTYAMANMYDLKPAAPAAPQAPAYQQAQPAAPVQQPVSQPAQTMPTTNTIPTTKINVDIEAYKEPLCEKSSKVDGKKYGVTDAKLFEYLDQNNHKLNMVTVTLNKWVTSAHTKMAELIDALKPNFLQLKYRLWHIENIAYSSLSKTMFEIKDVIQKAKAAEQEYDAFERLEMILHVLDDKSRGCGNFVENLIVERFNQFVYTSGLTTGLVENAAKILTFKESVKDGTVMSKLDMILNTIIDEDLMETNIVDCSSADVDDYIKDVSCGNNKIVSEVKATSKEDFTKWAKAHSVVVSSPRVTYWTNLTFNDTITWLDNDKFTVLSSNVQMDDSPIDTDIEYMIKTAGRSQLISNLIISVENVAVNYLMVTTDTNVWLRKAGLF